ncbi:hypothetical protein ACN2AS_26110 (plasmid) [Serratia liquefaciens]|uniref:hypothetical protein n=1 Tax=Serratia liquefaciens TaxID=614 RepID=UPI001B46D88F|nr:putative SprT family Zn-dependent metalloprotease [Serratia sp. PL17]CAE7798213.1 hypothetical protein AI2795V1_4726 [Serratia marcescens]CAH3931330.1 hypothetical protein AI2795V1_4726 [Serratia marcescens]
MHTKNGLDVIGEAVGISGDEMRQIAAQVKANFDKLKSCPYHEFQEDSLKGGLGRKQYRCKHCQGTVSSSSYIWHEIGRRPRA